MRYKYKRTKFTFKKTTLLGVFLRLSVLKTQHSVCEDAGSIPGLAKWFKDSALWQAVL